MHTTYWKCQNFIFTQFILSMKDLVLTKCFPLEESRLGTSDFESVLPLFTYNRYNFGVCVTSISSIRFIKPLKTPILSSLFPTSQTENVKGNEHNEHFRLDPNLLTIVLPNIKELGNFYDDKSYYANYRRHINAIYVSVDNF